MKKQLTKIRLQRQTVRSLNDVVDDVKLQAVAAAFMTPPRRDTVRPCISYEFLC